MTLSRIPELEAEIRYWKQLIAFARAIVRERKKELKRLLPQVEKVASKQPGGYARAEKLSPERRSEIGRMGAKVRWGER